ncbi:hypothetical protein LOZ51_005998 [Ophidiomyces ophidiicola]|nr:hypothetical protein LOZ51_005998 [Ophidiomyces ophidiicola]
MQSPRDEANEHPDRADGRADEYSSSGRRRFRLKTKSSSKHKHSDEALPKRHSERESRRSHRHHKRRKRSHIEQETTSPPLSPNTAFRESLFDAMADDEGAAYWEGVYGQPIHTYPRPDIKDQRGELERMTDEEYAAFVRAKMWQKTHEAVFEERERRRRVRQEEKAKQQQTTKESDREAFERMIDESLRRGKERKENKNQFNMWTEIWGRYLRSWVKLDARAQDTAAASSVQKTPPDSPASLLRNSIIWPVRSGQRKDITPHAVEEFIRNVPFKPQVTGKTRVSEQETVSYYPDVLTALKTERVRWHPDKVKHRYGILGMEEQLSRSGTEVFQILDKIWVEERAKTAGA